MAGVCPGTPPGSVAAAVASTWNSPCKIFIASSLQQQTALRALQNCLKAPPPARPTRRYLFGHLDSANVPPAYAHPFSFMPYKRIPRLPYSVVSGLETMAHILDYGSLETMLTALFNGEFFHRIGATGLYEGYRNLAAEYVGMRQAGRQYTATIQRYFDEAPNPAVVTAPTSFFRCNLGISSPNARRDVVQERRAACDPFVDHCVQILQEVHRCENPCIAFKSQLGSR